MSARPIEPDLPVGFGIRLRDDVWVRRAQGGSRVLIGGSPARALRLDPRVAELLVTRVLVTHDRLSCRLARRLLDANMAEPVGLEPCSAGLLTVVVPVRDRVEQLERCLGALVGLRVVVVDDASQRPAEVAAVVRRHGAHLIALPDNRGPAGARNAGLATVATPYVAFVDSDVVTAPATLCGLAGHLADPTVALVGPLVRGVVRSERPRWFERYDAAASSLSLGERPAAVQVGAAVAWLPAACLVGRVDALREPGMRGFDSTVRVGEDVDLVWRLAERGWRTRYDPTVEALHDVRPSLRAILGRKVVYGAGGAGLAQRHGSAVAVARLSPLMAVAGLGVLLRRREGLAASLLASAWAARSVHRALPSFEGSAAVAGVLAARGLAWSVRQQAALLLRHWWPAAALVALFSASARRAIGTALLVDAIAAATVDRPLRRPDLPGVGVFSVLVGRRLDDAAYGLGLWLGAARARSWSALQVVSTGLRSRAATAARDRRPPIGPVSAGRRLRRLSSPRA